jgi:hypothetical protein
MAEQPLGHPPFAISAYECPRHPGPESTDTVLRRLSREWAPVRFLAAYGDARCYVVGTALEKVRRMHGRNTEDELLAKIRRLPPEKLAAVEYFVDFLMQREVERRLTQASARASEAVFAEIWDTPDDADYDRL